MNLPGDDEGQQKAFIRPLLLGRPIVVAQGKRFVSLKRRNKKGHPSIIFPHKTGEEKKVFSLEIPLCKQGRSLGDTFP